MMQDREGSKLESLVGWQMRDIPVAVSAKGGGGEAPGRHQPNGWLMCAWQPFSYDMVPVSCHPTAMRGEPWGKLTQHKEASNSLLSELQLTFNRGNSQGNTLSGWQPSGKRSQQASRGSRVQKCTPAVISPRGRGGGVVSRGAGSPVCSQPAYVSNGADLWFTSCAAGRGAMFGELKVATAAAAADTSQPSSPGSFPAKVWRRHVTCWPSLAATGSCSNSRLMGAPLIRSLWGTMLSPIGPER
jgi:hypothetical protein